jgi:hypothetical protein
MLALMTELEKQGPSFASKMLITVLGACATSSHVCSFIYCIYLLELYWVVALNNERTPLTALRPCPQTDETFLS